MKNVIVRALSGVVYIALIVLCLLLGGWWWYALTAVFTVVATLEYQRMAAIKSGGPLPVLTSALDMAMTMVLWGIGPAMFYRQAALPAIGVIMCLCVLVRLCLSLSQKNGDVFTATAMSFLGILYVGVPMAVLNLAMAFFDGAGPAILCMFILIWLNDTGAFCVGSTMGKNPLCKRLSPKKSWEGFWGGLAFCVLFGAVFAAVQGLPVVVCALYGLTVSLFATWGDLFESLMKRSAGIKDSGNLIPGHGGILDRIDSLLFVAPASAVFYLFYQALA